MALVQEGIQVSSASMAYCVDRDFSSCNSQNASPCSFHSNQIDPTLQEGHRLKSDFVVDVRLPASTAASAVTLADLSFSLVPFQNLKAKKVGYMRVPGDTVAYSSCIY